MGVTYCAFFHSCSLAYIKIGVLFLFFSLATHLLELGPGLPLPLEWDLHLLLYWFSSFWKRLELHHWFSWASSLQMEDDMILSLQNYSFYLGT